MKNCLINRFNFIYFILVAAGMWPVSVPGQDIFRDYSPLQDYAPSPETVLVYRGSCLRTASRVEFENTGAKTAFFDQIRRFSNIVSGLDSMQLLMYSDTLSKLMNRIKDTIVSHNPELQQKEYKVFILRSPEPNAFSFGEGLILFDLGLIERLQTVDEVAMVLSHELSHDYFNHLITEMHRYYEKIYSKESKKEIRLTARSKTYRKSALRSLFNAYQADFMRTNKKNELQADSMGLLFCARAGYDVNTAFNVIDVLEHADELRYTDTLPLAQIFGDENFPFKTYWLEKENLSCVLKRDSIVGLTPDSLKTHPDCQQRREAFSRMNVESQVKIKTNDEVDALYRDFHWQYQFEMLTSLMQVKDYPKALYTALHLQNEYPENLYLKYVVANTLMELGRLAAGNDFLESVEFPDDQYSNGYNQILTFLQNLNSSSLAQLADHYLKRHKMDIDNHPYGAYLDIISNHEKPITTEVVADYQNKFPNAGFDDLLMERVVPGPVKSKK